jgi:hypothetical protein
VCRRSASARMSYADGRSDLKYGDRSWKDGSGEGEMTGWLAEVGGFVVAGIMKGHDDGV